MMKDSKPIENRDSGFTMIELIVVIACIAVLTAVAVPSVSAWLPRYRLQSAANEVLSDMQFARMAAIKNSQDCEMNFTASSNQYTVSSVSKTVVLGDYGNGVKFEGPGGETFTSATITFNSRGMSDGGYVYLSNDNNSAYYRIGPLTSGVIKFHKYKDSSWVGKWD